MKTIEKLIEEKSYCVPFNIDDLKEAYKLGQINILLELSKSVKGHYVNGLFKSIVTEEELSDKLVAVSND